MIASFLLLISIGVGNLYKFSFFSPDVHVSILDIVVFGLTIFTLIFKFKSWLLTIKQFKHLTTPILVFFTVAFISLVLALPSYGWQAVVVGSMYLVRWIVYTLFFASIIQLIKAKNLRSLLCLIGLIIVVTGFVQYFAFPDIRPLQYLEWDPHYYRLVGTFLDPGFTGLLLVFTLILFIDQPILWIISYLAFALTYSRASYLAFLVSMAYISWKQKVRKFFIKILLLFVLTIFLLPRAPDGEGVKLERTSSIQARIESWKTAWGIFIHHPVLGVGFDTYRYAQKGNLKSHSGAGADSSLLFVAATTGFVGLLTYLWYLRRLPKPYLVALLVHSLFLNSLFYPGVMVWLSLLIPFWSDSQPGH